MIKRKAKRYRKGRRIHQRTINSESLRRLWRHRAKAQDVGE